MIVTLVVAGGIYAESSIVGTAALITAIGGIVLGVLGFWASKRTDQAKHAEAVVAASTTARREAAAAANEATRIALEAQTASMNRLQGEVERLTKQVEHLETQHEDDEITIDRLRAETAECDRARAALARQVRALEDRVRELDGGHGGPVR